MRFSFIIARLVLLKRDSVVVEIFARANRRRFAFRRRLRGAVAPPAIAPDQMRALDLERSNAEAMTFDAVIAAPGVELDTAFAINPITLFQSGRDLGRLAEHGDAEPLHGVIFADTDAQAHPWLASL